MSLTTQLGLAEKRAGCVCECVWSVCVYLCVCGVCVLSMNVCVSKCVLGFVPMQRPEIDIHIIRNGSSPSFLRLSLSLNGELSLRPASAELWDPPGAMPLFPNHTWDLHTLSRVTRVAL